MIDPPAAHAVRLAFEAYATGEHSDLDVARLLNEAGIPPAGRAQSGRWTREGVRYLLGNPFYAGLVRHGGVLYPGQHEPLISRDLWDRVQAWRAERRRGPLGHGRQARRVYLLAKALRCSNCGLTLIAHSVGGRATGETVKIPVYLCPPKRRSVECGAGFRYVRAPVVEVQIGELIGGLRLPPDWRTRLEAMAGEAEDHDDRERKRRNLEGKLKRLHQAYINGDLEERKYMRQKGEMQAQLARLQLTTVPAVRAAAETLETLGAAWARATAEIRRDMLRVLFESVVVDIRAGRVVCVRPRPAFVVLFRMDGLHERQEGCFWYE